MKTDYLARMRDGDSLSLSQQIIMITKLSIPAILAQISSIIMQYIDAAMVGRLGANDSASIGLVSSSTWLIYGLCTAAATGFTVNIAKRIGAKDEQGARNLVKTGLITTLLFSVVLMAIAAALSPFLPRLLGAGEDIAKGAGTYFLIFALSLPFVQLNFVTAGMIECSGNMRTAGMLEILMCVLDVIFNALLIFPSADRTLLGVRIHMIGAGLGITGAALGTALSEVAVSFILLSYLLFRCKPLRIRKDRPMRFVKGELKGAFKIAIPVAIEQIVTCSAYIAFTRIVSPLGTISIAANSFSITAESLCYMPGYGIGAATATIIGQSIGAGRFDLTKRLARLSTIMGVLVMTAGGCLMYCFAPQMIALLSPDPQIQELGAQILRIEAFAEPLYAASIIATGAFRGAGDTKVPTVINLICMWAIRFPLAAVLATAMGLQGVWTAMCIELYIRGALFIILLATRFRKHADRGLYSQA